MKIELLTADIPKLFPFLETVIMDGGRKAYDITGSVTQVKFLNGLSGYEYQEEGITAQLTLGLILGRVIS